MFSKYIKLLNELKTSELILCPYKSAQCTISINTNAYLKMQQKFENLC